MTGEATTTTPDADATSDGRVRPETRVPEGEEPIRCPYCDRPFPRRQLRDLHVGEVHADSTTGADEATYEDVRDEEGDELFMYHLKVIAALVAIYAGMVILYMVVLGLQATA
jgi:hypothetical protein